MRYYLTIIAAFFITGCSSGPSESELQQLIFTSSKATLQQIWDPAKSMGSLSEDAMEKMGLVNPETLKITDLSIDESMENDNGDYVVKTTFTTSYGKKTETATRRLTLMQANDSWRILSME